MNAPEAKQQRPGQSLDSDLARLCLPSAHDDPNTKLAWLNSLCLLFLSIGVLGYKPGLASVPRLPAVEEAIPVIFDPVPPPPPEVILPTEDQNDPPKPEIAPVVAVVESPKIAFAVPTVATLVAPIAVAQAPPVEPMQSAAPVNTFVRLPAGPTLIQGTGEGGDRPKPDYPRIALSQHLQGTVLLGFSVNEAGRIVEIQVRQTSGHPLLDRSALDHVKRHWTVGAGPAGRVFEAPIHYQFESP